MTTVSPSAPASPFVAVPRTDAAFAVQPAQLPKVGGALKTRAALPGAVAAPAPLAEPSAKASFKSRLRRWFTGEDELVSQAPESADVQLAQSPATAGQGPVQTRESQTAPELRGQASGGGSAAVGPTSEPSAAGSRMPDFMNDMVGGMPLGAALSSGGMMLYGLAGGGNVSGTGSASSDTRAPVLQTAATSADGKTIVLTYDELLGASATMPAAGAFSVTSDGVAVAVSNVVRGTDGKSVVLNLASPITGLKTAQVSYTAAAAPAAGTLDLTLAIRDAAGNHAASFSAQSVTVNDTTAPTVLSGQAYTTADATVLVLNASETLRDSGLPPATAFTVTHDGVLNPVTAVSVVGTQVRLTLQNKLTNASGNANLFTVAYTAPVPDVSQTNVALQDAVGNDMAAIVTPLVISNHVFDNTAPTLSSATINALGNEISLTWSEAMDAVSTSLASAYTVQTAEGGRIRSLAVSAVRVSGSNVVLVLAEPVTSSTAGIQVGYAAPATGTAVLQDVAGNDAGSFATRGVSNAVDTALPTVAAGSFKDSKTLVLTYSEDLTTAATAPATAFSVTSAGKANAVTALKVVGKTIELSLTNAVVSGEDASWSYAAPAADRNATNAAVQDLAGNDMASVTAQKVDTTRATLLSANTGAAGNVLVMNFNEALLSTHMPAATTFQVLGSQSGLHTVSGVSVSGSAVNLSLSTPLLKGETVSMSYTADADNIASSNAALQDLAGNDVLTLGTPQPLAVANKVTAALLTKSLAMNATGQLNQLVLHFDSSLTGSPAAAAFSVTSNGTANSVSAVRVSGNDVTLDLLTPLTSSTSAVPVTVSYTAPAGNALQDSSGLAVGSFSATPVATVRWGTASVDTLNGTAAPDYFVLSAGADVLTGAGGVDVYAWPQTTATGTPVPQTTIKDFGLKSGTGGLQGASEADVLELGHLLVGYTSANRGQFLQLNKDDAGKLVLHIDHDGGTTFAPTESVLFDNITVNSSNTLVVNNAATTYSMGNLLDQLLADAQLHVS